MIKRVVKRCLALHIMLLRYIDPFIHLSINRSIQIGICKQASKQARQMYSTLLSLFTSSSPLYQEPPSLPLPLYHVSNRPHPVKPKLSKTPPSSPAFSLNVLSSNMKQGPSYPQSELEPDSQYPLLYDRLRNRSRDG